MGGTAISTPLKRMFEAQIIKNYPRQIFLLTDGAVRDTEAVIDLVSRNSRFTRVHCIGVGSNVSLALVKGCAEAGKGRCILIDKNEDPADKIIELLEASLTPLITSLNLVLNESNLETIVPNHK